MMRLVGFVLATMIATLAVGCGQAESSMSIQSEAPGANKSAQFKALFAENCAGCHGENGKGGAAIALNNAVYLAIADDSVIRNAIVNGGPGTASQGFGESAGGLLTDEQIAALINGIRAWARPEELKGVRLPRYAEDKVGDASGGGKDFQTFCASCHGADGSGAKLGGSVVDPSFLALVSDQDLRTLVIVGRPELGAPDWRNDVAGQTMSNDQISDVVAWLAAHRVPHPGGAVSASGERK